MLIGIERLLEDLRALSFTVDGPITSDAKQWAILRKFAIASGRFAGQTVDIAIQAPPDYPSTAPRGFYVSPQIAPMNQLKIHDRKQECAGLGGDWQYWSRPIPDGTWEPSRGGKRLLSHWNNVFDHYK